ncbi:hypothetical protein [Maribacter forsetii]|uniref:hypothetical protein n=1 Tax=Maribacter forsetii TaxID=444515 RepID=UPI0012F9071E|nr:hypothetical protein [Maribacter forsetii]
MPRFLCFVGKSFKTFLFGIIPFMLLAGGSKENYEKSRLDNGSYSFNVEGKLNFHLDGAAAFQSRTEVDKLGHRTDKLLLSFTTCNDEREQTLEFIIASKAKGKRGIQAGKHKIKSINRLMNSFSGVYGFADLGSVSELPFFIKSGDITITESFSNIVDGKLEVQLENAEGEVLLINGSFNADIKV